MSFATQALKYGWVALASLGALTGTTIYVLNNQRHQVKPEDVIELALGVTERCLALQQTNEFPTPPFVDPPSFVRTWYSNVYTTNGVTIYTNVVTNTIGWHIDRAMMISLDTTIKRLVACYLNTNLFEYEQTNYYKIISTPYLTVTGLWAELKIGDGTNRFTREPAWTNPISTNWIVNYTSYWPNEVARTNCYTSDYRQVVNYAESWTATGGYVWVTSSNWVSTTVTVTNAAAYGDYPWQIYVEDLEERYKVLEALKKTKRYGHALQGKRRWSDTVWATNWAKAVAALQTNFNSKSEYTVTQDVASAFHNGGNYDGTVAVYMEDLPYNFVADPLYVIRSGYSYYSNLVSSILATDISHRVQVWLYSRTNTYARGGHIENAMSFSCVPVDVIDLGLPKNINQWVLLAESGFTNAAQVSFPVSLGYPGQSLPPLCSEPRAGSSTRVKIYFPPDWWPPPSGSETNAWGEAKGGNRLSGMAIYDEGAIYDFYPAEAIEIVDWQFLYCTNKYW